MEIGSNEIASLDLPKNRSWNVFEKEISDKCGRWNTHINTERNGDCIGKAPSKEFES